MNSLIKKGNLIYWYFTIAMLFLFMLPGLFQQGMFLDGVTYAAISKNMANGLGSFWQPHYTKSLYPVFHEHPPLVFIIQSFFFRLLGDSFLTERIYSFLSMIITIFSLVKLYDLFTPKDKNKYHFIPVLLCLMVPIFIWSYKNNMLENTMGIFTILSVYSISQSLLKKKVIWMLLAVFLMLLAFLSKGPVGLFPIITPFVFALAFEREKIWKAILQSSLLFLMTVILLYVLILIVPDLKENLFAYFDRQLFPALQNQREITANNHFSLLFELFLELVIPIVLLIVAIIWMLKKNQKKGISLNGAAMFFLLIAISSSFPLLLVLKQSRVYLVPSIPYYILSISLLILPFIRSKLDGITQRVLKVLFIFSTLIIALVLSYSVLTYGKYSRDEQQIRDIQSIQKYIAEGSLISATNKCEDWNLIAYLSRIGSYSLDCKNLQQFHLVQKDINRNEKSISNHYELFIDLEKYQLMKRIEERLE